MTTAMGTFNLSNTWKRTTTNPKPICPTDTVISLLPIITESQRINKINIIFAHFCYSTIVFCHSSISFASSRDSHVTQTVRSVMFLERWRQATPSTRHPFWSSEYWATDAILDWKKQNKTQKHLGTSCWSFHGTVSAPQNLSGFPHQPLSGQ